MPESDKPIYKKFDELTPEEVEAVMASSRASVKIADSIHVAFQNAGVYPLQSPRNVKIVLQALVKVIVEIVGESRDLDDA